MNHFKVAAIAACIVTAAASQAATNAYLLITGTDGKELPGMSTVDGKPNWIEIQSFSFGVSNPTTIGSATGGAGAGKASFSSFSVNVRASSLDAKLLQACCAGGHFKSATLAIVQAGAGPQGKPVVKQEYTFGTVFLSSMNWSGSGGEDAPQESLSFAYGQLQVSYPGAKGTEATAGWDRLQNKQWSLAPVTGG